MLHSDSRIHETKELNTDLLNRKAVCDQEDTALYEKKSPLWSVQNRMEWKAVYLYDIIIIGSSREPIFCI